MSMQAEATQSATVPSKERPGVKESCVVGVADAGICRTIRYIEWCRGYLYKMTPTRNAPEMGAAYEHAPLPSHE